MKSAAMSQIRMMLLLLAVIMPGMASAVTVEGLYQVQVPVVDTSPESQQTAYAEGLKQVLARVAGNPDVLQSDQVDALLDSAESLVQAYQYQTSPEGNDVLTITYSAVGVNRALANMQVPVWGANRPLTLGWVAVDSGRDRWVLTADDDNLDARGRWSRAFREAAVQRGLPFALPPADVRDQRDLTSDIRGQFMESLRTTSSAYPHNLISVVNVSRQGSGWEASWRLDGPAFSETGEVRDAASSESLASAVIDAWADLLAARYSVEAGKVSDAQRVDLKIENIQSVEDYGHLLASLQHMTPVVSAGPVQAAGNVATMRVSFSGELSVLKEYIALDHRFQPVETERQTMGTQSSGNTPAPKPTPAESADPGDSPGKAPAADDTATAEADHPASPVGSLAYHPAEAEGEASAAESEQSFEALYPVLRYRWTGNGTPVSASE